MTEDTDDRVVSVHVEDVHALASHQDTRPAAKLCDELLDAADQDRVRVIVLQLTDLTDPPSSSRSLGGAGSDRRSPKTSRILMGSNGLYQALTYCKKPVVAEISGRCSGAASLVALYADLVVTDTDSVFCSPFSAMAEANFVIAALSMGLNRAKAWMLDPAPLSAQEAWTAGLVNTVVAPIERAAATQRMVRAVSQLPLDAITISKMNLNGCIDAMGAGRDFDLFPFYQAGIDDLARSRHALGEKPTHD